MHLEDLYLFSKFHLEKISQSSTGEVILLEEQMPVCQPNSYLPNLLDPEELLAEECEVLKTIVNHSVTLQSVYELVQEFLQMLANQTSEGFEDWLVRMVECGVKKIQNFATSLRQDNDAVKAALVYDWNNGQVEGQVNRLKTI